MKILFFLSQLVLVPFPAFAFSFFHYDLPPLKEVIGTRVFTRVDESRKDPHSKEGLMRELSYRVWYPAEDDLSIPLSNWGYEDRELIVEREAQATIWPKSLINLIHLYEVRSKVDLKPKSGAYPVVFLFHGLGPDRIEGNTDLAEFLVSKGFIVIGVSMPFGSGCLKISQSDQLIEYGDEIQDIMSRYPASRPELIAYRVKEHDLWVKDVLFSFASLSSKNEKGIAYADWNRLYMVGSSHGGFVALDACTQLSQCLASVNMDGFTYEVKTPGDLKHHLALYLPSSGDYMRTYCDGKTGCFNRQIPCDVGHQGFGDLVYTKWPFSSVINNQCGSESSQMKNEINQMIADFLMN